MANETNATIILPLIESVDSNIKIYTQLNGDYSVGDKIFICSYDDSDINADLDNYIYYKLNSGTTLLEAERILEGYKILEVDEKNNGIILDRKYETINQPDNITPDNFYTGKIYQQNSEITKGELNSIVLKYANIDNQSPENIKWYQGIILDGGIKDLPLKSKYDSNYISTNSEIINNKVSSYFSFNNNGYGFSYFIGKSATPLRIEMCSINNGNFYNMEIWGYDSVVPESYPVIDSGYFENGKIFKKYHIKGGYFKLTDIKDIDTIWENGSFDPVNNSTVFKPKLWEDGQWLSADLKSDMTWKNGTFSGNEVINPSYWENGIFNGNIFNGTLWENGVFNKGIFNSALWKDGVFNNGIFNSNKLWENGIFNGGEFKGKWENGIFNGGEFKGDEWINGTFNNGDFRDSIWKNGEFNFGRFKESTWEDGKFYNGLISDSIWIYGNFYNGTIINAEWENGDFYFGKMFSVKWYNGTFHNGIVNNSNLDSCNWKNGIFNSGTFKNSYWEYGQFNNGEFGSSSTWEDGTFYDGVFKGTWNGGKFYIGDYQGTPSEIKIIGKEYKPFIKEKKVKKLNKKLRPKKVIKHKLKKNIRDIDKIRRIERINKNIIKR